MLKKRENFCGRKYELYFYGTVRKQKMGQRYPYLVKLAEWQMRLDHHLLHKKGHIDLESTERASNIAKARKVWSNVQLTAISTEDTCENEASTNTFVVRAKPSTFSGQKIKANYIPDGAYELTESKRLDWIGVSAMKIILIYISMMLTSYSIIFKKISR